MKSNYDVIVVGGGNGGLVAGAECAKAGLSTALFEKHNLPGGCATSFVRGRFEFEASLHELAGIMPDGSDDLSHIFTDLGINIDWRFDDYAYRVICKGDNGFDVKLPTGEERFIQAIEDAVPGSKQSVEKLFTVIHNIFSALKYMNDCGGKINPIKLFTKYPDFLRASSTSAEAIMNELKIPEKAKNILCTYWGYLGVPTDELCATHFLCLLGSYVSSPVAMPRNKSHALSVALDKAFAGYGGEAFYNTPVTKFIYNKKGECIGVEACGRTIYAKKIIANIMPDLVYELSDKVPEYNRRVANAKEFGASFLTVYLGLDASAEELGIKDYSLFVLKDGKPRYQYENRNDLGIYVVNCLEKVVENSSPEGTCTLFFTIPIFGEDIPSTLTADKYKEYKNSIAERYIKDYEQVTGVDVLNHIEEISIASPVTFARYLGTPIGEVYGYKVSDWDNIINRTVCSKSEQKIKNLYFCGGHQDMGDGFSCAYSSGKSTAEQVIQSIKEGK